MYRELVLAAAERVFADKGYAGAKIKDVADEAGLALGTLYTVFDSKRDIFVAVHEQRGSELVSVVGRAIAGNEAPFDAIGAALAATCRYYAQHPDYLRMHLHSKTSWAAPHLDEPEEREVYTRGLAPLGALFAIARSRGELVDEEPDTIAQLVPAMLQVYLSRWAEEDFATDPERLAARVEGQIRRSFQRAQTARS